MKLWSFLIMIMAAAGPARADTPMRCERLDRQATVFVERLPPKHQDAAKSLRDQAARIAAHQGVGGEATLVRLKSHDSDQSYLAAFVPAVDGQLAALIVHSTITGNSHSLVDAHATFVIGVNEPQFAGREVTSGTSYMFFDRHRYHVHISNRVTEPGSPRRGKIPRRFGETATTGFVDGGLPASCRPRS
jgi:hypothetical protein